MLQTALALVERGLRVFPCKPRAKVPATPGGCKDATKDPNMLRHWWGLNPAYNLAIATGPASGIFVIDVDGLDGECELRRLEAKHGALPPTVEVTTPRPGRHVYFKMPGTLLRNSAGKIAPGVDVRALGGYVVAPPSIHPSGRAYAWSVDCAGAIAPAPDWLLAKIIEPVNGNGQAAPPEAWRALVTNGVSEGQRDCSVTKFAGYLLRHHVDPLVTLELLQVWNAARCTPPLPAEDIGRIVNSITGRELKRRARE
jgi:hypothetical protein